MSKAPARPDDLAYARSVAKRIGTTQRRIFNLFDKALFEASLISEYIDFDPEKPFSFEDYPLTKKRSDKLLSDLYRGMLGEITAATAYAWKTAEEKNDQLEQSVRGRAITHLREDAHKTFLQRVSGGMTLSDRVWRTTKQAREEIEMTLDIGLRAGMDAPSISRELRACLNEPERLFRRVRDEHGQLHLSKRAAAYHPGRGVYRSSYKNAMRLTATETNIAYRTADYMRVQQMDFVRGIRVQLSQNHTLNGKPFTCICDDFAGDYPKDFKFTGWHPLCRCYTTTILAEDPDDPEATPLVTDVPQGMRDWVSNNGDRIEKAFAGGKPAYWLRDNTQRLLPERFKAELKEQRKEVLAWGKQHLVGRSVTHPAIDKPIHFTTNGLKEAINQPHSNLKAKNRAIRNIDKLIEQGEYAGSAKDEKGRPFIYHYLTTQIGGKPSVIVLREDVNGTISFYSIVEKRREATLRETHLDVQSKHLSENHLPRDKDKKKFLLARAKARHEARTPEEVARIQARWDARQAERRRQATLARAKIRHEARSASEIEAIKKRWEVRGNIRRYSDQLEHMQQAYKDVAPSLSALAEKTLIEVHMGWIRGDELAKRLATLGHKAEIKKLWDEGREVRNLAQLLHTPKSAVEKHGIEAIRAVYSAVEKKLQSFQGKSLAELEKSLAFEVEWVEKHKKYDTWQVARDAYAKRLKEVRRELKIEAVKSQTAYALSFAKTSKSKPAKLLASELEELLSQKWKSASAIEQKAQELRKKVDQLQSKKKGAGNGLVPISDEDALALIDPFMKRRRATADKLLRGSAENYWSTLTVDERAMLTKYTQTYSYLNEPLRGIVYTGNRSNEERDRDLPLLTSILSRNRTSAPMVVRRGVGNYFDKYSGKLLSNLEVGDEIVDYGFLSTSVANGYGFGGSINLVIVVPQGAQGVYAEPFSHYTDSNKFNWMTGNLWDGTSKETLKQEMEWIGQRGAKMRVLKRSGNTIFVKIVEQGLQL